LLWLLQENYAEGASTMEQLWGLAVLVAAGVASYFLFAHVIGAFRISELRRALSK
jgi:hypothetical protein